MPQRQLTDDVPATRGFPQFESELYQMVSTEVEGLTNAQLDFDSDKWEWSKWSIRRNLSHVASGDFRWLLSRWGPQLFPRGYPPQIAQLADELKTLAASPYDRRLDEDKYWDIEVIMEKVRQGLALCHLVLSRKIMGAIRNKHLMIDYTADWKVFSQAHPKGVRQDPEDPSKLYISLEATFRHRYFEYTTHLYNIQRFKEGPGT